MTDAMQRNTVATVIVAGPNASHLFDRQDDGAVRDTARKRWGGNAAWLLAASPDDLLRILKDAPRDGAPCALLLPLVPAGGDELAMRREWREWQRAVAGCAVLGQRPIPVYAAVYACLGPAHGDPVTLSSGLSVDPQGQGRISLRHALNALREGAMRRPPGAGTLHERLALSFVDWAAEAALLALMEDIANTPPLFLGGVFLVDAGTTLPDMAGWMRWLIGRTGLSPSLPPPRHGPLPLPPLAFDAQRQGPGWNDSVPPPRSPRARGLRVAAMLGALALIPALLACVPYLRAKDELDRYAEGLRAYGGIAPARMFDKCAALLQLRAQHDQLGKKLADDGVGSWIYRQAGAQRIHAAMSEAIAAYTPPQTALRLDSMAVFESGSATLIRASAARLLDPASQLLRANPDLHVRIVGHTDGTGSPERNLALSLARAQAVRDQLVAMSGTPLAQFETAGRGAAQPVDDNATAAGRARNRRVDITLTPLPSAHFACGAMGGDAPPAG